MLMSTIHGLPIRRESAELSGRFGLGSLHWCLDLGLEGDISSSFSLSYDH